MRRVTLALFLFASACSDEVEAPAAGSITAAELQPRSNREGKRFALLDPIETGVAFTNELLDAHVLQYIYSGAGAAVGDYDADGRPDIYMVSQDGSNKLFRQVAPLRFEDVTESAGGLGGGEAWGNAATFADVDSDGDLDLYVCNTEAPNLLYQKQGDGTFVECAGKFGLAFVAASTGAAFADYDNDGDLDLYLLTNRVFGPTMAQGLIDDVKPPADTRKTVAEMFPPHPRISLVNGKPSIPAGYENFYFTIEDQVFPAGQPDKLLRNDGYAQWRDVTKFAGIADHGQGLSVTWWDCDGDGWLDIYVANDLESPDQLYRNRGDGTFEDITERALPHTAYFGMGSDFGDIDNDGRLDFCVADMASTSHYMSKMLMGTMGDKRWFLMNAKPPQYMRNAVFVNSGTERFLEAGHLTGLASTDWTWTVRFADLDEDGLLDFFATNGQPRFDNNPDVQSEFLRLWRLGVEDQALDVARDLDPVNERNIARRNLGGLRFEDVSSDWGLDLAAVSHGAVLSDLDRDGDLDIVVNNMNTPASVYENRTAGTHRVLVTLRGQRSNAFGIGSKITLEAGGTTQTRLVSPTRGFMSTGEPIEHFGLGSATTIDRLSIRWPSGAVQAFEDLAADKIYTVHEPADDAPPKLNTDSDTDDRWFVDAPELDVKHTERDFDDYAVQPLLPHRLSRLGPGIAWSDVNGDGRDDCFVGGAAGEAGTMLRAEPNGRFTRIEGPWSDDAECEDMGAVFVDHDRDGDLDLYVVSGGIEHGDNTELLRDRLYVNDGRGSFARAAEGVVPDLRFAGGCVCAADFDRDGDLDLFVGGRTVRGRYPEAPPSALLINEENRFVERSSIVADSTLERLGMVSSAIWTDLNGDDWLDLVVAAQWQPIRVLINREGKQLVDAKLAGPAGLWNSIAAADLDQDGDQDLVATNIGLNSKYHGDDEHPLSIYAHDFDENGVLDVVEAKFEGDSLLPVRGRSCSSQAMPFVGEKFKTFDSFARASLDEIYGERGLGQALELSANELRSVVFENVAGQLEPKPLPHEAQISPGYGIGIADFDGDGVFDLAIAQNSFSPEPETGRFGGGLGVVLRGRGDLEFDILRAHRSGIAMPEDAKALSLADLDSDGTPELVCTTNDGPVRTFRARDDSAGLAVRLNGEPGNPSAIGAIVVLLREPEGEVARFTIGAGSGYLSQHAPRAFFASIPQTPKLIVKWPDGSGTEHALERRSGTLVIRR